MFYKAARWLCRTVLKLCFRWEIKNAQRLPSEGPVLVVSNHANLIDPIIVGCCFQRQVHFMAKGELFKIPLLSQIIRLLGAYPVRRGIGDRSAIEASFRLLEQGGVVGMFPEGTRHRDGKIHPLRSGAALLATRGNCPIVPVVIDGSHRINLFRFPKITAYVGEPFRLPANIDGDSEKEKSQKATGIIQQNLEDLWNSIPAKPVKKSSRDTSANPGVMA